MHHGTMVNHNNRFMFANQYSALRKNWPILLLLVGIMAGRKAGSQGGRQADRQNLGGFQNFSNSLKVKIFGLILFVITVMLLQY